MSLPTYLLCTFFTTLVLAALSWHFVEKPALKLKPFRG
jgi:peptidoglycan/LPS O-acetylase OafA/YrhL